MIIVSLPLQNQRGRKQGEYFTYLLWCVGVTLKQRNGLDKDELELQLYGFIVGYISSLAPLELSDIKQINQLGLFNYLYFVRHSTQ